MIKFNEDEKYFKDDNPYSSIAMPPELLASQTVGVVPTNEPQRYNIFP